jgi:hypothetical protein
MKGKIRLPFLFYKCASSMKKSKIYKDLDSLRQEHIDTLELIAKLNNWKTTIHSSRLNDESLSKELYGIMNKRLEQLYIRLDKLEKELNLI